MNQLLQDFKQFIAQQALFSKQHRLLVAVSGGLDSVVLCHLLHRCGFLFEMAHVNFRLRENESDRDEKFVEALARELSVTLHTTQFDTAAYAISEKISIQVAARDLRYAWFNKLLAERQNSTQPLLYILTAHHANDNAETILMNIFRGTGLTGLRGILPKRDKVIRPLLFAQRSELLEFAKTEKITWMEDSSNASSKYARNYIRNTIIPQVEQQYPSLVSSLNIAALHARETELFFEKAMEACLNKLVTVKGQEQQVPVERWRQMPGAAAILYAWLKPFGFSTAQMPDAISLAGSQTGHYVDSEAFRLLRNRKWLVLTPKEEKSSAILILDKDSGTIGFSGGQLNWKTLPYLARPIPAQPQTAWLDAAKITYPLLLRPWKTGDYFYPLGMAKKKKVARFLIDIKLARPAKDQVWVLESDRKIIWVIGHRMDDRFKIKPTTKNILELHFSTAP
jgi:tRNA(Ile)-lysidine synthase